MAKYILLVHDFYGQQYKQLLLVQDFLAQAAFRPPLGICWLPPGYAPAKVRPNIFTLFDQVDSDGVPLISSEAKSVVMGAI